jgi:hypothetical protein
VPRDDRYEPLPGLLGLPAFVFRKLSPRGRRVVLFVAAALVAGSAAGAVVLIPRISESKHDQEARERRERARAEVLRRRRLVAEQRPRRRRSAVRAPAALVGEVERAVSADVNRRVRARQLPNRSRRAECRMLARRAGRLVLSCVAVTSDIPRGASRGGIIGYPYRALADPGTGDYAFCKTSGHPAEGLLRRGPRIGLPRACGGLGAR